MRSRTTVLAALAMSIAVLLAACSSRTEPSGAVEETAAAAAQSGYDLGLSVAPPRAVEVNESMALRFTVTNAGPDEALGIITIKDMAELGGVDLWVGGLEDAEPRTIAFDPGKIAGGDKATRAAVFRFVTPTEAHVEAFIAQDEPPDRNPSDNQLSVQVVVTRPGCTERGGRGDATIEDRRKRQVVCTRTGDDTITAGDRDVVRSSGGRDTVTCRRAFCVLELGSGNDVARCPGACYVDGGPGKDDCPDGREVIRENCER